MYKYIVKEKIKAGICNTYFIYENLAIPADENTDLRLIMAISIKKININNKPLSDTEILNIIIDALPNGTEGSFILLRQGLEEE